MLSISKEYEKHVFVPGDWFSLPAGFIGMIIKVHDHHMTPYMIVDVHGDVRQRATSIGLCFNQFSKDSSPKFIGRLTEDDQNV